MFSLSLSFSLCPSLSVLESSFFRCVCVFLYLLALDLLLFLLFVLPVSLHLPFTSTLVDSVDSVDSVDPVDFVDFVEAAANSISAPCEVCLA